MILPTKHIVEKQTLLGVGAVVIRHLERPQTVSSLWGMIQTSDSVGTYERFILALDLLYILGVINIAQGMISREVR